MTDRDELRQAVARAIRVAFVDGRDITDAAIAAYEAHRPRPVAPDGCQCGYDDQCAFAARAEKAEAEAYGLKLAAAGGEDAPGAANAVTIADVERWREESNATLREALGRAEKAEAALDAAWCAGRDAAAEEAQLRHWPSSFSQHDCTRAIAAAIRALTPPEDKP
jgi:hypothetical protein